MSTPSTGRPRTHKCPGPECIREIPYDRLACSMHWSALPQAIRIAIYRAWDGGKGAGSDEHTEALKQAIAYWNGVA